MPDKGWYASTLLIDVKPHSAEPPNWFGETIEVQLLTLKKPMYSASKNTQERAILLPIWLQLKFFDVFLCTFDYSFGFQKNISSTKKVWHLNQSAPQSIDPFIIDKSIY